MKKSLIVLMFACCVYAQDKTDGDKLVTVPSKYVSAEGLTHKASIPEQASQWVGLGREIGEATNAGLNAVVDVSGRFSQTNVGRFVMLMVAWKVMGREILGVVLGIPLSIATMFAWFWSLKRFFLGSRVLKSYNKTSKEKIYENKPAYDFQSGDARVACGLAHIGVLAALFIMWGVIIFA